MLYRLVGVRKGFGAKDVLLDATWQHDPGRIVGLVGRNGAGKSTVLQIVLGEVEPDDGRRLVAGGTTFASLDQAVEPEGDEPLRAFVAKGQEPLLLLEQEMRRLEEAIASPGTTGHPVALEMLLGEHDEARERFERGGGYEADSRVERVMGGVGLPKASWDRPVGELSGGQKHRAQIARLLLTDVSVLLLDEPTNHLDVNGIEFLETWLIERKVAGAAAPAATGAAPAATGAAPAATGAALVVSHDRRFLNAVSDRIVEVAHGRLEEYPGDYDSYRRLKAERDRLRARAAEQHRKLVERTEDFIRKNIAGQKTKQAQSRRKMLAKLEHVDAPREDANEVTFRFEEARASGARVLDVKDVVPGYSETGPLMEPLSLLLRRGDRIALWGPNGCGKTTLLKTLARVLPPISGSFVTGSGVLTGYYDQEMTDLPAAARVIDAVWDLDPTMKEGEARDFLALFDFRGDEVEQRIATLSGGEKGRLSLARIIFGGANLLLLDEPTNHLDLDAREQLEDALQAFEGAIVFVSHDRWFVDRIATRLLVIEGGRTALHDGTYSDMVRRRQEGRPPSGAAPAGRAASRAATKTAATPTLADVPAPVRPAPRPDRATERRRAKEVARLGELEDGVTRLEAELHEAELALADPEVYRDGDKSRAAALRRDSVQKELERRVQEWEELSLELETSDVTA